MLDPQAWVLAPDSVIAIARAIVGADSHYHAGLAAARCALQLLQAAHAEGRLKVPPREIKFLDAMEAQLDDLPADESAFIAAQLAQTDPKRFLPAEYGL